MPHDGTGTGYDETLPADADQASYGAQEIRDLRKRVRIMNDKEHVAAATSSAGGEHKAGSAVAYYQGSAPTQRPDAATNLSAADNGRLFVDSDDKKVYVYVHGTGFVLLKAAPAAELTADDLAAESVGNAELKAEVAGAGLAGGAGTALSVTVDNSSIEIDADTLRVKAAGVTAAMLATAAKRQEIIVSHRENQNTSAGTLTAATWNVRPINTEDLDEPSSCSIATNQITLTAGSYLVDIECPAYDTTGHQARLQDITNTATLLLGTSEQDGNSIVTKSRIQGKITLADTTVLEIQHNCNSTQAANGMGLAANLAQEVYTVARFTKVA